ncbi:MAG: hypothetical protein ACR2PX_09310 [Endozoicomonas sp.]|uniref:hypothetical protein n=1 Tax=Endozoicomonas sp. TaxID=1892382 RepID=UPI003D9B8EB6
MIEISEQSQQGEMIYSHLDPVVDHLLSTGCELSGARWQSNREGYYCKLSGDYDLTSLSNGFNLPETIYITNKGKLSHLFCDKSGAHIEVWRNL